MPPPDRESKQIWHWIIHFLILLPDPFVIEAAIARKIPVLTTSYISPDMQAQHERCVEAGIPVLNEIGEF